ncbi:class I SAM-dependent methyltransferase [Roseateles sp.]|uniref:class I SAM-dependent methyltransferase n=1 Tax=Roseateles sp. TaxID=1971397 RepID=UPI0031D80EB5
MTATPTDPNDSSDSSDFIVPNDASPEAFRPLDASKSAAGGKPQAPGPLEANAERAQALERKGAPAPAASARSAEVKPPPSEVWNRRYAAHPLSRQEAWLDGWSHRLPGVRRALDIGCGDGWETAALLDLGVEVTAMDISAEALARCRRQSPGARPLLADVRAMPMLVDGEFDLAVAQLSLHYFDREDTRRALCEIARVLAPGGKLIGCVNAADDWHYGAPDDASAWELVVVDGVAKQFFTREKLEESLAACFEIEHLAKRTLSRYGRPKSVWEFFCRKKAEKAE